jgi:hypothetical protein
MDARHGPAQGRARAILSREPAQFRDYSTLPCARLSSSASLTAARPVKIDARSGRAGSREAPFE